MSKRWAMGAGVAAIVGCFLLGLWLGPIAAGYLRADAPTSAYVHYDSSRLRERTGRSVILFSTATCGYCAQARALLDARGVDYADLRIDDSGEARQEFEALSAVGVPVLLIGQRRIEGFREQSIVDALIALGSEG